MMSASLEALERVVHFDATAPVARDRDQVLVLHNVSWTLYESMLAARGERPRPRFAYLDGTLEIMTTSNAHEVIKKLLARLLECYAEERGLSFDGAGQETHKAKGKQAGFEADESYYVGRARKTPDLALEVVHRHGGLDKLEVYRRFGVREVWFWIDDRIQVHRLVGARYRRVARSVVLRGIDLDELARIVSATGGRGQTQAVRAYRRTLQRR